jgi:hypothetical protein
MVEGSGEKLAEPEHVSGGIANGTSSPRQNLLARGGSRWVGCATFSVLFRSTIMVTIDAMPLDRGRLVNKRGG